jgi:hypothetical protein
MLTPEEMRGNPATALRLLMERTHPDREWAPGALERLAELEAFCDEPTLMPAIFAFGHEPTSRMKMMGITSMFEQLGVGWFATFASYGGLRWPLPPPVADWLLADPNPTEADGSQPTS